MVLTVSFVVSLVIGFLATITGGFCPAGLMPASRHQDATTSPSAMMPLVWRRHLRPSHPAPNVRDDREAPLLWARDARRGTTDLPVGASAIFSSEGQMTKST